MENKSDYSRILLKISGDFLRGNTNSISLENVGKIVAEIGKINTEEVSVSLVVGGGNILRGGIAADRFDLPSDKLDEIGMQATLINSGIISTVMSANGIENKILSAIPVSPSLGEEYSRDKALNLLSIGKVIIFAGGTGNPFFTTDTAAVMRALQIQADVLLKATKVDGIYDKDPEKFSDAKLYRKLTYNEAIRENLKIMDLTAFSLAKQNNLSIIVFNAGKIDNIKKVVSGEKIGTLIEGGNNG